MRSSSAVNLTRPSRFAHARWDGWRPTLMNLSLLEFKRAAAQEIKGETMDDKYVISNQTGGDGCYELLLRHQKEIFFRAGRAAALTWLNQTYECSMHGALDNGLERATKQKHMKAVVQSSGATRAIVVSASMHAFDEGFYTEIENFINAASAASGGVA
jgi:hypothetical protein